MCCFITGIIWLSLAGTFQPFPAKVLSKFRTSARVHDESSSIHATSGLHLAANQGPNISQISRPKNGQTLLRVPGGETGQARGPPSRADPNLRESLDSGARAARVLQKTPGAKINIALINLM